ncbi:MAG: hypothetical protein NC311_00165 [Muribaculaceae bacterium]|nr:hypothetical protein [Muribaculaceae bacterium]
MTNVKVVSDTEYKAHVDKVKPFQTAIDLVTLAEHCELLSWDVGHSKQLGGGTYTHIDIKKGSKAKVQEILARNGISGQWEQDNNSNSDVFFLPTETAAKHPLLVSMRAIKMEGGKTSPQNLVLQLAQYMPNNQK